MTLSLFFIANGWLVFLCAPQSTFTTKSAGIAQLASPGSDCCQNCQVSLLSPIVKTTLSNRWSRIYIPVGHDPG